MKNALKIIGKILLILLIILIIFLLVLFIYHRIMLNKEKILLEPLDGVQMVEVDGHKMSVYVEGNGKHTIVFMSGWGVASPILDFKTLYKKLSDDYKIVVIEKFGYGFSDDVTSERSFGTILKQNREALEKAGIKGPYILCPHSLSGLEALFWAQQHPEDVEAIIGLDISLPTKDSAYNKTDTEDMKSSFTLNKTFNKLGLFRLMDIDSMLDAINKGALTEKEKDIYRALIYSNTGNKAVKNEIKDVLNICKKIEDNPNPNIPMLMFISKNHTSYEKYLTSELNAKVIKLDCGHYVYVLESKKVSDEIKDFINNLER